jgi:branched-chain amino acid transport system ATP-binding protein
MSGPALAVDGLAKTFGGVRAVDGASFAVAEAEMLALIGPNGAGKSTCFNMIGGQLRPDAGRVSLAGRDVTGAPPRRLSRLGVGRTFQITETFASMTVRENVQIALLAHQRRIWGVWRPVAGQAADAAERLLDQVGLAEQAERAAGVLANQPRVLLMDEPTAGMAPAERAALMALVRRLASEQRLAVLFTEHDMDVVFGAADRILVLNRGRLIAEGNAAAIRADARVREVYLGGGLAMGPG